jgi:hypothetical protein
VIGNVSIARRAALLFATCVFVGACSTGSADGAGAPYQTVVDTLGDTIVARTTGDVPERFLRHVEVEWKTDVDPSDTVNTIGDVSEIAVGTDGRVFVWDDVTPTIWLVADNGRSMKRIGRKGSGPGEYDQLNGLVVRSDGHLIAWDAGNARLNVYDADGTPITSWLAPIRNTYSAGALTADTANRVWMRNVSIPGTDGNSIPVYVRWNASGVADTVRQPDVPEGSPLLRVRSPNGNMSQSRTIPYSTFPTRAISPLGFGVWSPLRPYTIHGQTGGRPLRIERDFVPVPLSDDERAQHRVRIEASMRRVNPAWTWDGPDVPADKPPLSGIQMGTDGRFWVALYVASERYEPDPPAATQANPLPPLNYRAPEKRWDVFEPDGRYVGRVVAPRLFTAYAFDGDSLWGILRDENDVPSIVKMRMVFGN